MHICVKDTTAGANTLVTEKKRKRKAVIKNLDTKLTMSLMDNKELEVRLDRLENLLVQIEQNGRANADEAFYIDRKDLDGKQVRKSYQRNDKVINRNLIFTAINFSNESHL